MWKTLGLGVDYVLGKRADVGRTYRGLPRRGLWKGDARLLEDGLLCWVIGNLQRRAVGLLGRSGYDEGLGIGWLPIHGKWGKGLCAMERRRG